MPKTSQPLIVDAVEALRKSRNELHMRHRLSAGGTGPHRNKKCYTRKVKYKQIHREE